MRKIESPQKIESFKAEVETEREAGATRLRVEIKPLLGIEVGRPEIAEADFRERVNKEGAEEEKKNEEKEKKKEEDWVSKECDKQCSELGEEKSKGPTLEALSESVKKRGEVFKQRVEKEAPLVEGAPYFSKLEEHGAKLVAERREEIVKKAGDDHVKTTMDSVRKIVSPQAKELFKAELERAREAGAQRLGVEIKALLGIEAARVDKAGSDFRLRVDREGLEEEEKNEEKEEEEEEEKKKKKKKDAKDQTDEEKEKEKEEDWVSKECKKQCSELREEKSKGPTLEALSGSVKKRGEVFKQRVEKEAPRVEGAPYFSKLEKHGAKLVAERREEIVIKAVDDHVARPIDLVPLPPPSLPSLVPELN